MPQPQPLSGHETMEDLGCDVTWVTLEDHSVVEFTVAFPGLKPFQIEIRANGGLHLLPEPIRGFTSAPALRKAVGLLAWCYRTAYKEVFRLQDVDQLLFM